MGEARFRGKYHYYDSGFLYRFNNPILGGPVRVIDHSIRDETGLGDCGPLVIEKYDYTGGLIIEPYQPSGAMGGPYTDPQGALCSWNRPGNSLPHKTELGAPDDATLATLTVARTNPSRPVVDLPVAAYELRELPQLIMTDWKSLLNKETSLRENLRQKKRPREELLAELNLIYQFGWAPLMSDISKLMDFGEHVNKRFNELKKLRDEGLRRTYNKRAVYSGYDHVNAVLQSAHLYATTMIRRDTTEKAWGYVEWIIDPGHTNPITDAQLLGYAKRAVTGFTIDFSTLWNMIPFSWLADWTSNVGTYLAANRNIVPATHRNLCVMRSWRTAYTSGQVPTNWYGHVTPITSVHETKTRKRAVATLTAQLPFLNARQLSILGSIGLLTGKRKPGMTEISAF